MTETKEPITKEFVMNQIQNYFENNATSPLFFVTSSFSGNRFHQFVGGDITEECEILPGVEVNLSKFSKKNAVLKVLELSSVLRTALITDIGRVIYQCSSFARRSSLDIWRMIKANRNDISLLEVMRILYDLKMEDSLYRRFCGDIERRVFRDSYQPKSDFDNQYALNMWDNTLDEYGLTFDNWGLLDEVKE